MSPGSLPKLLRKGIESLNRTRIPAPTKSIPTIIRNFPIQPLIM